MSTLVDGKWGKDRKVPIGKILRKELTEIIPRRDQALKQLERADKGYLFANIRGGFLAPNVVYRRIVRAASEVAARDVGHDQEIRGSRKETCKSCIVGIHLLIGSTASLKAGWDLRFCPALIYAVILFYVIIWNLLDRVVGTTVDFGGFLFLVVQKHLKLFHVTVFVFKMYRGSLAETFWGHYGFI